MTTSAWLFARPRPDRRRAASAARGRAAVGCAAFVALCTGLAAHDAGTSESRIDVDGATVRCALYLNVADFPVLDQDRNTRVTIDELDRGIGGVFDRVKQLLTVTSGGDPTRVVLDRYRMADDHTMRLDIVYAFPSPVDRLAVTSRFDQLSPVHQHVTNLYASGVHAGAVLTRGAPSVVFDARSRIWTGRTALLIGAAVLLLGGRLLVAVIQRRRRA